MKTLAFGAGSFPWSRASVVMGWFFTALKMRQPFWHLQGVVAAQTLGPIRSEAAPIAAIAAIRRTNVTEHLPEDALLWLDVGGSDHLGQLFDLVGNEFSEFGGCQ